MFIRFLSRPIRGKHLIGQTTVEHHIARHDPLLNGFLPFDTVIGNPPGVHRLCVKDAIQRHPLGNNEFSHGLSSSLRSAIPLCSFLRTFVWWSCPTKAVSCCNSTVARVSASCATSCSICSDSW